MMFYRHLLFLFATSFILFARGQQLPDFRFQQLEGLSQNTVFNVMQDKQGFLWAGTGDGLNRYDGASFKTYKPSPLNADGWLKGRVIRNRIIEDDSNRLWIGTENGLQYFDKRKDRFQYILPFHDSAAYMNGSLYPIRQVRDQFWFGQTTGGLLSYNLHTLQYQRYPFPGADKAPMQFLGEKTLYDGHGNFWSPQNAGLYRFNIETGKWTIFLEHMKLRHSCLVKETLYLVTENGILLFNITDYHTRFIPTDQPGSSIRCITSDRNNQVWIGDMQGKIYRLDENTGSSILIGNINEDNRNVFPVYSLFFDASDILWVGTDGMGLLKANIHPTQFLLYPDKKSKETLFIKSLYEDKDGSIWLGTFGKDILLFDRKTKTARTFAIDPFNDITITPKVVSFIREDQYGNLWIGYGNKLFCRKNKINVFTEIDIPVTGARDRLKITGMLCCENAWFITTTLGSFRLRYDAFGQYLSMVQELDAGDFSFIHPIGGGRYLLGFYEGGLCLYTEENGFLKLNKYLVQNMGFKCVLKDPGSNKVWFGTDKGLMLYDTEKEIFRLFTEADGLSNGYVYGILESGKELWLSSNGGLSNVKIMPGKDGDFPSIRCKNYSLKDGLQANEFNTGAYLKARDGTLFFGGINGLNWLDPSAIKPANIITKLAITRFTVNDSAADKNLSAEYIRDLVLNHTQNNLYFQFRALEYSNPGFTHYAYQLTGWDKGWIYSNENNEARYNNLPPGEYVFNVKASNNDGVWMKEPYTVNIEILPPFWKKGWFYALVLLVLLSLIIWITKLFSQRKLKKEIERLERQKALEIERMRISQEMHDDIGAGLTQISLISESAKFHSLPDTNIRHELDDIASTSRKLVDNIGEIIWSLHPQHDSLEILMSHLREQLNKLTEYAAFTCHVDFPEQLPDLVLNNQLRRNILLVCKEIVHNAIKYSQGDHISIKARMENKGLAFMISDNGIGFDEQTIKKGNGLDNIRKRVNESGGQVNIESQIGQGTTFRFWFPINGYY